MKRIRLFLVFAVAALAALVGPAGLRAGGAPELAEAVAFWKSGKLGAAQAALAKVLALQPGSAEAHYYLGRVVFDQGDYAQAVAHLEKAVALEPASALYHLSLGHSYGRSAQHAGVFSKLGLAKKCREHYERAVQLEPLNIDNRWALMDYCRQAPGFAGGGPERALQQAAEIAKIDAVRGRTAYATLYLDEKKNDLAFEQFESILRMQPDDCDALMGVGWVAAVTGTRLDRGTETLRRLLTLDRPGQEGLRALAHLRLGTLAEKKRDPATASREYRAALEIDPALEQARKALARLETPAESRRISP